ncbi:TetR/AcrR family transcriptional regulator [Streptosporangium amethystogenes]|uniref:TetR/AcrR family transcriptional regulator n=1 Tax=Streptosporangium amethystogenes TaxID=2002 RepID=UPI00379F9463
MMDDTRSRLVESALRLLREEGLDAVTLRAVGDLTGLSRTAPYRHFTDKTALLAALAVQVIADLGAHLTAAIPQEADRRDRLRAFYLSYVEYAVTHREEYRLVFASEFLAGHHPELEKATDQVTTALDMVCAGEGPARKAQVMALISTAHGLAELTVGGQFAHKGFGYEDVVDVLVYTHGD